MSNKWIKKGDKVVVIAGNEKGKTGLVVMKKVDRIVIQGVNLRKKHAKRTSDAPRPNILEIEAPIHISNVSLCNDEGKPIKLKVRFNDGKKELFYRLNGKEELFRSI
ncbi:MAG: 50S ribosomal protein L24 [Rhabdochlamydiaceae bacterium]